MAWGLRGRLSCCTAVPELTVGPLGKFSGHSSLMLGLWGGPMMGRAMCQGREQRGSESGSRLQMSLLQGRNRDVDGENERVDMGGWG